MWRGREETYGVGMRSKDQGLEQHEMDERDNNVNKQFRKRKWDMSQQFRKQRIGENVEFMQRLNQCRGKLVSKLVRLSWWRYVSDAVMKIGQVDN